MNSDDQLSLAVRLLRARKYAQAWLEFKAFLKQHPRVHISLWAVMGALGLLASAVGIIILLMINSSQQVEAFPEPGKTLGSAPLVQNADTGYTPPPTLEPRAVPPVALAVVNSELPDIRNSYISVSADDGTPGASAVAAMMRSSMSGVSARSMRARTWAICTIAYPQTCSSRHD